MQCDRERPDLLAHTCSRLLTWLSIALFLSNHHLTMAKGEGLPTMLPASKKKRSDDDPLPPDVGQKPIQLQRRRVWRACESCRYVINSSPTYYLHPTISRRKKIKCDGCEPTCSQCTSSGSQCTWLQTKDRAALSRQYVIDSPYFYLTAHHALSQATCRSSRLA